MRTKLFLVAAIAICFATTGWAQQKFNVQNGTKTEFYDDLETAISKAASGDTIYLPGKVIQVKNDVIIDKKLAIIGAGCDVDSIGGLQTTEIKKDAYNYATINFRNGSDGSLLTGCIVGTIQFGQMDESNVAQQNIQNVIICRNKINGYIYFGLTSTNNLVKQIIVSENIIVNGMTTGAIIIGNDASECIFNNNLCQAYANLIDGLKNSRIYNNILYLYGSGYGVSGLKECAIENNFFIIGTIYNCSNSSFNNNAFTADFAFPVGSNTGNNNLMGQTTQQTFEVNDFTYPKNLKILNTSPCKNAGTDGTDIGIFGGPAPYKPGAVPFNPHITQSSISAQTDKDGKLKVNIQVSAQTR